MDNPGVMDSTYGVRNLTDNDKDFVDRQRSMTFRVLVEYFPAGPFNGKKVEASIGLADLDGSQHIRMRHARPELGFTHEPRDGSLILTQLFAQHLHRHRAVRRMIGLVH